VGMESAAAPSKWAQPGGSSMKRWWGLVDGGGALEGAEAGAVVGELVVAVPSVVEVAVHGANALWVIEPFPGFVGCVDPGA
jgi:hypothetical protein